MNIERYKTIDVFMTIAGEDEPVKDWALDIRVTGDKMILDQGFREVVYHKNLVKNMELHLNAEKRE